MRPTRTTARRPAAASWAPGWATSSASPSSWLTLSSMTKKTATMSSSPRPPPVQQACSRPRRAPRPARPSASWPPSSFCSAPRPPAAPHHRRRRRPQPSPQAWREWRVASGAGLACAWTWPARRRGGCRRAWWRWRWSWLSEPPHRCRRPTAASAGPPAPRAGSSFAAARPAPP